MSGRLSSDHTRSFSQGSRSRSGPTANTDSMHHPSTPARSSNPNVFSDEYSLEPIDPEQVTLTPRSLSISSIASSHTLRGSLPHQQQKPFTTTATDDEPLENPFRDDARVSFEEDTPHRSSLPQKGDLAYRNSVTSNSTAPSTAQRSQSTSSRFSIPPRALSPYTGATGPSHPYAMYPQVGVSRSPSVATTSTIRPVDAPLVESNGPQHPYAMYSQNVVVEEGLEDSVIPLGFPGHGQEAYQRPPNRAADDVGDLIGPDGYTEQLPPYSRYPEGASPKLEATVVALPDVPPIPDQPNGNTERDAATSDVSSRTLVAGQPTIQVGGGSGGSGAPDEPAPTGVMAFEEKLKRRGKKKVCCGLPVWTLVLVSVVMIVGGSIGGAIGGILGAKKAAEDASDDSDYTVVTQVVPPKTDATPISGTPTGMPAIPTGKYAIPAAPKNQSKFCIQDQDQTPSWGCYNSKPIPIEVGGDKDHRKIEFDSNPLTTSLTYGAQAPFFTESSIPLDLVMDTSDLSLGPALSFFTYFDKLVAVPEDTFSSSDVSRRSVSEDEVFAAVHHRKRQTEVGDRPWFCWWNSTVMEFFLYINQTTKESRYSTTDTSSSSEDSDDDTKVYTADSFSKRSSDSASVSNYPRRIKMEEKRDYADAQAPYCQQMQIMDNGSFETVSPETIGISVNEPTPTTTVKGSATQTYTAKAQYQSICYCASLTD